MKTLTSAVLIAVFALSAASGAFALSHEEKTRLDAILAERNLNEFGDPRGTKYPGGTPLFNESTGVAVDRYDYVLEQHPELRTDVAVDRQRESFVPPGADRSRALPPEAPADTIEVR